MTIENNTKCLRKVWEKKPILIVNDQKQGVSKPNSDYFTFRKDFKIFLGTAERRQKKIRPNSPPFFSYFGGLIAVEAVMGNVN